jgi:hypothetical protein
VWVLLPGVFVNGNLMCFSTCQGIIGGGALLTLAAAVSGLFMGTIRAHGKGVYSRPGPRRTPGHCLRAPISQCPGTTGHNENKALPFPRNGNAPQHGEAPAAFGHPSRGFWGPVLSPRRPRIGHEGQNKLNPQVPPGTTSLHPGATRCTSRGYPGRALRSTAAREMTPLRRSQLSQINSHRHVWVFKSPQHTLPKKVTKNIVEIEPLLKKPRGLKRDLVSPPPATVYYTHFYNHAHRLFDTYIPPATASMYSHP